MLQVLPSLITGGVERGTIEITQAISDAGWTALVASALPEFVVAVFVGVRFVVTVFVVCHCRLPVV